MHLSRLMLNPRDRAAQRDLADPVQLHRTVLRAFPPLPPGADFRRHYGVLYRVDADPRTGAAAVLVQSTQPPDWSFLAERPGYLLRTVEPVKSLEDAYGALAEGQALRFRLRANVTKKVATIPRRLAGALPEEETQGRSKNGRRVALRRPEEQLAWLARKGAAGGFELLPLAGGGGGGEPLYDVRIIPEADAASRGGGKGAGGGEGAPASGRLTFGSALFEGRLRITDREAFLRTLAEGLGSAKAFGFGLLSLARA